MGSSETVNFVIHGWETNEKNKKSTNGTDIFLYSKYQTNTTPARGEFDKRGATSP